MGACSSCPVRRLPRPPSSPSVCCASHSSSRCAPRTAHIHDAVIVACEILEAVLAQTPEPRRVRNVPWGHRSGPASRDHLRIHPDPRFRLWRSTGHGFGHARVCSRKGVHPTSARTALRSAGSRGRPADRPAVFAATKRMYPKDVLEHRRGAPALGRVRDRIAIASDPESNTGGLKTPNRPLVADAGGSALLRAASSQPGRRFPMRAWGEAPPSCE